MEAALIGEQISQVFVVINPNGEDFFVTWNQHNHTENNPDAISYIPEYIVEDEYDNELEQGCQDWLDAVAAVKEWHQNWQAHETD